MNSRSCGSSWGCVANVAPLQACPGAPKQACLGTPKQACSGTPKQACPELPEQACLGALRQACLATPKRARELQLALARARDGHAHPGMLTGIAQEQCCHCCVSTGMPGSFQASLLGNFQAGLLGSSQASVASMSLRVVTKVAATGPPSMLTDLAPSMFWSC